MNEIVPNPDTSALEAELNPLVARAQSIAIVSADDYSDAGNFLRDVKTARGRVQEWFSGLVEAAHKAHKALTSRRSEVDAPLAAAEAMVKAKMSEWFTAQERKRREEEDRLRREAEQRERERVAAERARLDEERKAREAEALERAARLESSGRAVEAMAVLDEATTAIAEPDPVYVPPAPVFVPSITPKVAGVTTKTVWRHRVVNFALLPDKFKLPNESAIAAQVRQLGRSHGIPGVDANEETVMAASGR